MKRMGSIVIGFVLATTVLLAAAARLDEGRGGGNVPAVAMPMPAGALGACVVSGPAALICGGVLVTGVLCYMYCDDIWMWMKEHTTNKSKAKKDRHDRGKARRIREMNKARERKGLPPLPPEGEDD